MPDLRFKLDVTWEWSSELMDEVAATGAVEIVDFKGHYGMEMGELPLVLDMYERAIAAFPDALLEDAHDLPEVAALLAGEDRISYDAPIHSVADVGATPLAPRALNIKPCRVGDLRSLLAVYDECTSRGLLMYGGGMGELDVGRDQIQLLASLFHADGPNDTAPSGYNADTPASNLPSSPLDPARHRRASAAAEAGQSSGSSGRRVHGPPTCSRVAHQPGSRSSTSISVGSSSTEWWRWPILPSGPASLAPISCQSSSSESFWTSRTGSVQLEDLGGLDRLRAEQPVAHPPGPPVEAHHAVGDPPDERQGVVRPRLLGGQVGAALGHVLERIVHEAEAGASLVGRRRPHGTSRRRGCRRRCRW